MFIMNHSKQSCQRFDSISLMLSLSRPWTCSIESLTSLKRLHLFLGHYFLFQRKNEELIIYDIFSGGELEKIKMQGEDLYLPTAPSMLVKGIQIDSGIPLQSNDVKPQACIFK
ncbi:hypothetical protein HID58_066594 [Brassica napus]|uniref:Uncharacterized protein n=1 Tax=Brassica napus TaxID=3708 RepID=A0ABQ7ZG40_BRANA|nr:hypothetical protein HID58_066594 [Brassica napus]